MAVLSCRMGDCERVICVPAHRCAGTGGGNPLSPHSSRRRDTMKSIVHNPKNRRLLSAFGGLLLVVALVLVAWCRTQTGSSPPTPASHTPGTKVCTYTGHSDVVSELAVCLMAHTLLQEAPITRSRCGRRCRANLSDQSMCYSTSSLIMAA